MVLIMAKSGKWKPKARNWVAVAAHFRKEWRSENRRAADSKSACRGCNDGE